MIIYYNPLINALSGLYGNLLPAHCLLKLYEKISHSNGGRGRRVSRRCGCQRLF